VKLNQKLGTALVLGAGAVGAMAADADATGIITAGTSAFQLVAALCITIGTFMLVYKLVKKIR